MSIGRRIAHLYEVTVNALLDRAADPREALDYSYRQQQNLLLRLRRDLAEVAATRMRAGRQESQLRHTAAQLEQQARQAALTRADELRAGQAALREDEEKLSTAAERLAARIEAFAVHKEAVKARYTSAAAAGNARELSSGIWAELDQLKLAIRRAGDVTARIEARASALASLLAPDSFIGVTGLPGDDFQAQPGATRATVEEELARIKDELRSAARRPPPGSRGRPRS